MLNRALVELSEKAIQKDRKIRVRICFSSSSLFQKLFHPQSLAGKVYQPSMWTKTLGLPDPKLLQGLDLQVKSIFLLPFSVMHPKFLVVDRRVVVLPSCNVSWEVWFEGAITMTGGVVGNFVNFWREFWAEEEDKEVEMFGLEEGREERDAVMDVVTTQKTTSAPGNLPFQTSLDLEDIPTLFLPSPHHRNPNYRLPWQTHAPPPPTPLNTFILHAISTANSTLYIQTPNLTSPPVLSALLAALARGINIHILTSSRLMILEQLVTAGTTTTRCIRTLQKRHKRLLAAYANLDLEQGNPRPGDLKVEYFEARQGGREPQQSHFKCLVVDQEIVVLGSGNLDRASWYTSQELGVAVFDRRFAEEVMRGLEGVMAGRKMVAV